MRNIFVSKEAFKDNSFSTYENYKKAVLLGQLCLMVGIICIAYIFLDSIHQRFESIPFYIVSASTTLLVFLVNRNGHFKVGSAIFLFMMILLMYVFTDNDHKKLGTHMYLVVYALTAVTLYGYERIWWSCFFVGIAVVCFYTAYFVDLPAIIQAPPFSEALSKTYFIANFLIVLLLTSLLVFFLISINYKANKAIWYKSQELIKANNELDRFVYSASHDLKAPLNSLTGLIDLSKRSKDVEEIKSYLNLMTKSIYNLDSFIHEIIDFSRNAKTEVNLEAFNLMELVKEVVDTLKFSSDFDKVQIENHIQSDLLITSDPSRVKVILHNIIGNALKYHNPNQPNPLVRLKSTLEPSKLIIEVEDNGIGINEEYKLKIFDMFFRATDKSKGSGLGLYIVKETIEKLTGKIEVSSQIGKGSIFRIELPLNA